MSLNITRRNALLGMTCIAGIGLAAPHVARAAARTIRLGHNNTEQSHYGQASARLAQLVADDPVLGSVLKIEVHGNAELGDELGMLKNCAAGTLDMMICSNSVIGNVIPDFGLLNAPFIFSDTAHARAALDGAVGEEFAQLAPAKGLNVAAWGENGLRQITANQPIRSPADLKGLKIRVPQSEVMLGGFRALGADAAPLSFGLLREALRTGQFQAQENPIVIIESIKLYELQKFLTLTGHIYDPAVFMTSADLMEDLTGPQRAALIAAAKKGAALSREVAQSAQQQGIARLKTAGMTVVDDPDVAAFRTASRPYLDGLVTTFDADRVKRLISAGV